jgi:hypothetical protein
LPHAHPKENTVGAGELCTRRPVIAAPAGDDRR